jgi:hypothetical protein
MGELGEGSAPFVPGWQVIRPRKQRYTGRKIYEDITAKGYQGSGSNLRHYIAQRRREKRRRPVYIPLEFDPGTDAQVD